MSAGAHIIHFILSLLTGGFWIPLWILCALCAGSSNRKKQERMQREQIELMKKFVERDWK